eukprot:Unigene5067_Nuclearia_a/m.15542 Unigene5067_Nuclearia_a/g.15542  ORF Unigene5067_Nuclearia_a/g.15542 Unigene5067_Nuclearia_a/m.15542 type:complete len:317 (-) Unigene5067_Nuclearia_a:139-1089(-)
MTEYNQRSPAVRRILKEAKELHDDPSDEFVARPLDDDIFEWHFTIRGPPETAFEGGLYHGRIVLPPEYPMKPPSIVLLTPNGRFEVGKKICLSITGYHPEYWQPAWGVRSVCTALQSFFPVPGEGAVGALDYTPEERRAYAKKSLGFVCDKCKSDERMDPARLLSAIARKSPVREAPAQGLSISFAYDKPKPAVDEGSSSSAAPKTTGEASDAASVPSSAASVPGGAASVPSDAASAQPAATAPTTSAPAPERTANTTRPQPQPQPPAQARAHAQPARPQQAMLSAGTIDRMIFVVLVVIIAFVVRRLWPLLSQAL